MKIFLLSIISLLLAFPCFADQRTTVLDNVSSNGLGKIVSPYIDGSTDTTLEASLNRVIDDEVAKLVKKAGKNASLTYTVMLNRPSLVSILLKAEGNKTVYKGLNLDITTGKEFTLNDFFVNNDSVKDIVEMKNFVLGEKAILHPSSSDGDYDNAIEYGKVLENVRIGEAGRIFQVARLTDKSASKTLHLEGSGLVAIKLASNPSTGFSWQIMPTSGVKEIGRSFNMPNMNDSRTGVPGEEIIVFAVSGEGLHSINLQYKRAWEKSYAQSFMVNIKVD
ncbi:MAG: protease inhibitor I42 family protein [Phascolarctobacterium sp.]|nr:protease inhibitor I42 family protein [Phascolarctobacterium sp.]